MTQISERYRTLADEMTRRVAAVTADRWDDPSPCEGWSARDVLGHVIGNHRELPGQAGVTVDLNRSVSDEPVAAWLEARDAMQDLLEDPSRAGAEYEGAFGRASVQQTVDQFGGFDLLVHAWDIARATGQDETLPSSEVSTVHAMALRLGEALRLDGVCGPAVPVPEDAPEQERLLGLLGRRP